MELPPELADVLTGSNGLRVEELVCEGQGQIIKDGAHRTVYRLTLPQGEFFVKRYRLADWRSAVRTVWAGSKAEREWRALQQLRAAGIPTVEPVGRATRFAGFRPRESCLILQALDNVRTIHDILSDVPPAVSPRTGEDRHRLCGELARLIATLHSRGFLHHDLHAGNILARAEPGKNWRLWLIDLHTVRQYRRLSVRQVCRELAMFGHFFSLQSTPAERLRFFRSYWQQIVSSPESKVRLPPSAGKRRPGKALTRKLAAAAAAWSQRAFRKADEKWHRGHRKLIIVQNLSAHCRGIAELGSDTVRRFAAQPKAVLQELAAKKRLRILAWGKTVLGETVARGFTELSRSWLGKRRRWSPARTGWEMGHALLRRGIDTPRPLLWREQTDAPQREAVLVTENPFGEQDTSAATRPADSPSARQPVSVAENNLAAKLCRRLAVEQAGRLLRRLHDAGFLHQAPAPALFGIGVPRSTGDDLPTGNALSVNNTFCGGNPFCGTPSVRVMISDAAGIVPVRKVSWKKRRQQLAALYKNSRKEDFPGTAGTVSPSLCLRFLQSYLGRREFSQWKSEWRAVARLCPTEFQPSANSSAPPSELHSEHKPAGHKHAEADGLRAGGEKLETLPNRRRFLRSAVSGGISLLGGLSAGCRSTNKQIATRPARHSVRAGKLVVMSDYPLNAQHPLIEELVRLRKQVAVSLHLPPQRADVVVYIFSTPDSYQQYLDTIYPGLPRRRAYFVGTREELAVYTYWGERIQEDLRHEYTHGLLHASLKSVPLWIDEGLAEYFEVVGPRIGTVNTDYARRLAVSLKRGWQPRLQRLERIREFSQMRHLDYQEAWAWVHFLLHHSPETRQILLSYLHDLRTQSQPRLISQRLQNDLPGYQQRFTTYVAGLQTPQLLFRRTAGIQHNSGNASGNKKPAAGHVQLTSPAE